MCVDSATPHALLWKNLPACVCYQAACPSLFRKFQPWAVDLFLLFFLQMEQMENASNRKVNRNTDSSLIVAE